MQRGSLKVVKNRAGVKVWRAQWRENGTGRTRYLGTYAAMDRSEARAQLDGILVGVQGTSAGPLANAITLCRFIEDEYLIAKNRVWKASTRVTTEQIIQTHILEGLGARPLSSVNRKQLQAHLDIIAGKELSFSVVAHVRWQLEAIFKMAEADGLIKLNPASGLVMPKCKASGEKRTITIEDLHRAQMVLEIRERIIFRLAVSEGMRPGEIVGLQVGDFGEDGVIYIRRRVYRGIVDTPKSKRSTRKLPTTQTTRVLIRQWIELLGATKPEQWLFASENPDTPLSYSNVYRRSIQPALAKVGLEGVNFQALRRTTATELSAVEPDSARRAQLLGHSVDVHENEYRQPDPAALQRTMRKMGKRLQ